MGRFATTHESRLMRKVLELLSLTVLAAMLIAAALAVLGPTRLPDRIPTHFDPLGRPNGWASPRILLVFPVIAAALYFLMTWVSHYPAAFNFPIRSTPRNPGQLEKLTLNLIAWLKTEVVFLFAWIEWTAIDGAHRSLGGISPLLIPIALVAVFGTIFGHIVAALQGQERVGSEDPETHEQ